MLEKIGFVAGGLLFVWISISQILEEGFSWGYLIGCIIGIGMILIPFKEARDNQERRRRQREEEDREIDRVARRDAIYEKRKEAYKNQM